MSFVGDVLAPVRTEEQEQEQEQEQQQQQQESSSNLEENQEIQQEHEEKEEEGMANGGNQSASDSPTQSAPDSPTGTGRLHDPSPLTKTVVLYENERYQISSFGWSKNGLLPTDRKHLSTRNGKTGWATLEAADMAMITHGWTWTQSAWSIEQSDVPSSVSSSAAEQTRRGSTGSMPGPGSDGEGWVYAASFGSMEQSGSAVKGMTHFVRRRRRSRQQSFVGPTLIKGTCDHCDSEEVQKLSDQMLEALTQTSLHENPGEYSEVVTNRLKNTLHELLGIASRGETFHDLAGARQCLDKFFVSVLNAKSTWSKLSSIVGDDYLPEKLPARAVEVSTFSFSLEERREVARMLIRKYDTDFAHHCHKYNCGSGCTFALTACGNLGCSEVLSARYMGGHLETCKFTPLVCERGCGEAVARKEMACHLLLTCELRPADCPYASIGCKPDGLTVSSLPLHCQDPAQIHEHLSLSLQRLAEQQDVIVILNKKVIGLESTVAVQGRAIKLLQGGTAATIAAAEQVSHREVHELERRLEKQTGTMAKQMHTMDENMRTLERESSAQKAQLQVALANTGDKM